MVARITIVCLVVLFGAFAFLAGVLAPASVKGPLRAQVHKLAANARLQTAIDAVTILTSGTDVTVPTPDALSANGSTSDEARYALEGGLFSSSTTAKGAAQTFEAMGLTTTLIWIESSKQVVVAVGSFETRAQAIFKRSVVRSVLGSKYALRLILLPPRLR